MSMALPRRLLLQQTASATAEPPAPPLSKDADVVVVLAALLCALICAVGLALVARCAWLRRRSPNPQPPSPPRPPNKGLKKKVLDAIPKLTFDQAAASSSSSPSSADDGGRELSPDCAICLAEFSGEDEVRVLPQCGHAFHVECVDRWLSAHSSCPSCRQILIPVPAAALATSRCEKCGGRSEGR